MTEKEKYTTFVTLCPFSSQTKVRQHRNISRSHLPWSCFGTLCYISAPKVNRGGPWWLQNWRSLPSCPEHQCLPRTRCSGDSRGRVDRNSQGWRWDPNRCLHSLQRTLQSNYLERGRIIINGCQLILTPAHNRRPQASIIIIFLSKSKYGNQYVSVSCLTCRYHR